MQVIDIQESDISTNEIEGLLELESFVQFPSDVLLTDIKRVIIQNDNIFILDDHSKIVCFTMKGELLYLIDNVGAGPQEYQRIRDIGLNVPSNELIAFDDHKRKLFVYDAKTGNYKSEITNHQMAPMEMGIIDGTFFFKNMDCRFEVQKGHPFYLLYSKNGIEIDEMLLPHDAVSEFNFDMNAFFYNQNQLFFCRPFDSMVYLLKPGEITPLFDIQLPNVVPMKLIEEKIPHREVPTSGYSYGIGNVYVADDLLHFTFSKDGFVVTTFYDLSKKEIVGCTRRVLEKSKKELPFYSIIDGVYEDRFFSMVSSQNLLYNRDNYPEYFPDGLKDVDFEDNPILAFFKKKECQE